MVPVFPKFCTLILKCSYIFINFANVNVNFSTFERIWLILTPRHTFNEEIWTISQQNITLLWNFFFKIDILLWIFGAKSIPRKMAHPGENYSLLHIPGYPKIASIAPSPPGGLHHKQVPANRERNFAIDLLFSVCLKLLTITDNYHNESQEALIDLLCFSRK